MLLITVLYNMLIKTLMRGKMETSQVTNSEEVLNNLKDIRSYSKKRLFWARLSAVMIMIFTICSVSVLPMIARTFSVATERLESLSETIDKVNTALDSLTEMTNNTSDSLEEAMNNLNSIDFEGLNSAIEDLGDVVEPLASFFGKFK